VARHIVIGEASAFATGFLLAGLTLGQRLAAGRLGWEVRSLDAFLAAPATQFDRSNIDDYMPSQSRTG
jgi:hypothetical protein